MKTSSLEVIILDFDASNHGSSPSLAVIFITFCCCVFCWHLGFVFFFGVCVVVVIFGVEKACFIIIHALVLHIGHFSRISTCKYNYMKWQIYRRTV